MSSPVRAAVLPAPDDAAQVRVSPQHPFNIDMCPVSSAMSHVYPGVGRRALPRHTALAPLLTLAVAARSEDSAVTATASDSGVTTNLTDTVEEGGGSASTQTFVP